MIINLYENGRSIEYITKYYIRYTRIFNGTILNFKQANNIVNLIIIDYNKYKFLKKGVSYEK